MPQIRFRLGLRPDPAGGAQVLYSRPPSWILWVLLIKGGKGKEDKGWRGGEGKGEGDRGGKRGRREGRGSLGRGKKGGKGNGGDKSPAWSSQDLGSTETITLKLVRHNASGIRQNTPFRE